MVWLIIAARRGGGERQKNGPSSNRAFRASLIDTLKVVLKFPLEFSHPYRISFALFGFLLGRIIN